MLAALGVSLTSHGQRLDPTFRPPHLTAEYASNGSSPYTCAVVQPDGRVIVSGEFQFIASEAAPVLRRLLPDGSLDPTFNRGGSGPDVAPTALLLQPDGKLLLTGNFKSYNGLPVPQVLRLLPNGLPDPAFVGGNAGLSAPGCLALDGAGRILLGNNASGYVRPPYPASIARLLPDGQPDAGFVMDSTVTGQVRSILVQADGGILVGGRSLFPNRYLSLLLRLSPTGALDTTFVPKGLQGPYVAGLAQQSDGQLLVAGDFDWSHSPTVGYANAVRARLDGSLDTTFVAPFTHYSFGLNAIVPDGQGGAIVGSYASSTQPGTSALWHLDARGAIDPGFASGVPLMGTVGQILPTGSGYLIGGRFGQYGGVKRPWLAHVSATGTLNTAFAPRLLVPAAIGSIQPLPSGQFLTQTSAAYADGVALPPSAVRRFQADGALDQGFTCVPTSPNIGLTLLNTSSTGGFYTSATDYSVYESPSGLNYHQADGILAPNYYSPIGIQLPGFHPTAAVEMPDGSRILTGYRVIRMGGNNHHPVLYRQSPNGVEDFGRRPYSYSAWSSRVWPQPDGRVLVSFGETVPLVRLMPSGRLDSTFNDSLSGRRTRSVFPLADGRILVNRVPLATGVQQENLQRLTATGALDPSFSAPDSTVLRTLLPDGRLVVMCGQGTATRLLVLLADGAPDPTVTPVAIPLDTASHTPIGVAFQPSTTDKLLLWGDFRTIGGEPHHLVSRLLLSPPPPTRPAATPLDLRPNPARAGGALTLTVPPATAPDMRVQLIDAIGHVVYSGSVGQKATGTATLPLPALAAGLYTVRVGGTTQRLVVE